MLWQTTRSVISSNCVHVAVYCAVASRLALNGRAQKPLEPQSAPTAILFSHATGFHGRVFSPVARALPDYARTTFDYRGHGDTAARCDWPLAWEGFGDDALAVARDVSARNAGRRIEIGRAHV